MTELYFTRLRVSHITQQALSVIFVYNIKLPVRLSMVEISTLVDTLRTHLTTLDVSLHRKDQICQRFVVSLVNLVIIYILEYIHIIYNVIILQNTIIYFQVHLTRIYGANMFAD